MNKKNVVAATIILALLAGVGWALFSGEDAQLAEAKQLRDEMFKKMDSMNPEERHAQREILREKTRDFTEAQRREFGQGMRQFMMQRVDRLLDMPPEQQRAELDKWIDRMEEMRKNREGRGGEGRGGEGRGGPGGRGGGGKGRLDRSTPEMRGKLDAMKDLINDRRAERGMEPIKGGGPFGRGLR